MTKNRGKRSSSSSSSSSSKRKVHSPQQERHEDWCFECKDGGELMLCDYRNCGKVYHHTCLGKGDSFLANAKSWICAWHYCYKCNKSSNFFCLGCPNGVCKQCRAKSKFTLVKGEKGLCRDCAELAVIVEQNLEHDSEGNKITLEGRETYEALFKEYWEIIKVEEGLTSVDVSAALAKYRKAKDAHLRKKVDEGGEEEEQYDSVSGNSDEDDIGKRNSTKRKKSNPLVFVGWASKPLNDFLVSIGKYSSEPLSRWGVRTLIFEYIKEKNLYDPRDKSKFVPDEKLFPIFRKKVMSKYHIYHKLEVHLAVDLDDRDEEEKNNDQNISRVADKYLSDQISFTESKLSDLIGGHLLKKGDSFMKASNFALISTGNIKLVYLKRSLVIELSKQPENFMSKVVGAFVRVKVESSDCRQPKSYHLVRVVGVIMDEILKGFLLQVSFMPKAIPISELSDDDFTEEECGNLQQKVKANLLQKLTVMELQEKAKSLNEDITKHSIRARLVNLQNQIDRANLRGRIREKIALLDERERLEQSLKQEQRLKNVPSVSPELVEAEFDSEED